MAFTAFEELGKLNNFFFTKKISHNHPEKHLFSIAGNLSENSHITRCYPEAENWFVSKFNKNAKDYGLMKFRNNLLYFDKNNIPSRKFGSKDVKNMIIVALEVLHETEGFVDTKFSKDEIVLKCQREFRFSKKLFRN